VIRRAARRLPRPARDALRRARSTYRSARYRANARLRPVHLGVTDVEGALREAGVERGDDLFMQAAMSAFGTFEEGPATVIEGVLGAVGPDGLVAMPAYPLSGPAIEYLADDPVFDVRSTPSRMGAISEAFRKAPGTGRSIHPTHSMAAWGPGADDVLAGHDTASTPFGEGTPFPRLVGRNGWQVFFGTGTNAITMYHSFECVREPPFPLDVFADRVFDARCVGWDGEPLTVRTLVHNPALHPGRIDSNPRLQRTFREALLDGGGRAVRLARGEILAIRLRPMFETFERLLGAGVTIYEAKLPTEQPRRPPQERVAARLA
jgi:aminoglycoside 3-N-acetyltransferase